MTEMKHIRLDWNPRTWFTDSAEDDEDPFDVLARGGVPELKALRVFNSTVYRWNRACYGITGGKPHLRIENRVLPSGPTPADEVANAAFWLGLLEAAPPGTKTTAILPLNMPHLSAPECK